MRRLVVLAILAIGSTARAQPVPAEPTPDPEPPAEVVPAPEPAPEPAAKPDDKADKADAKQQKKKSPYEPKVNGYIQVAWQAAIDTNDDGSARTPAFRIQRARVELDGKILKKIGYALGIDVGTDDISTLMKDAYLWTKYIPFHELRVGQQKVQFGYENVESSSKLYYVNRAKVSDDLSRGPGFITTLPHFSRDIGIGLVGEIPVAPGVSIEDGVTAVNGAGPNVQTDDTVHKNYWGRIGGRYQNQALDLDVRLGVSGGYGDSVDPGALPDDKTDDLYFKIKRIGVDLQADYTYAFVAAEYVAGRDTEIAVGRPDLERDADGYYVLVAGKTPWKAGPIVRYDRFDNDFLAYHYKRWTLGAYYGKRADKLRVMVNYEHRPDRDDRLILWSQAKF